MKGHAREFRPKKGMIAFCAVMAVASILGAVLYFRSRGGGSVIIIFIGLFFLSLAGLVQALTTRVALEEDHLLIANLLHKRKIPQADIETVTWEAGCGVSVRTRDGTWHKLPDTGHNSQGQTNSIRAWLKQTAAPDTEPQET